MIKYDRSPYLQSLTLFFTSVKGRIERIEIFAVKIICGYPQAFAEPLVMNDLSLSEEAYRVYNIGVVAEAQNVVIGCARFLLSKSYR